MTDLIKDCDDLIAGMEKCGDAWWGDIGEASDEDWRKLREIAYRIRARASLQPEAEATIHVPVSLFYKILEQHQLAADALPDVHGDTHRYIVEALSELLPQRGSEDK